MSLQVVGPQVLVFPNRVECCGFGTESYLHDSALVDLGDLSEFERLIGLPIRIKQIDVSVILTDSDTFLLFRVPDADCLGVKAIFPDFAEHQLIQTILLFFVDLEVGYFSLLDFVHVFSGQDYPLPWQLGIL